MNFSYIKYFCNYSHWIGRARKKLHRHWKWKKKSLILISLESLYSLAETFDFLRV